MIWGSENESYPAISSKWGTPDIITEDRCGKDLRWEDTLCGFFCNELGIGVAGIGEVIGGVCCATKLKCLFPKNFTWKVEHWYISCSLKPIDKNGGYVIA